MSQQFLSEIRVFSFNFAPKGWAFCNGQMLPINQNQALFALIGTFYGGDGIANFALPDLRGRVPFHQGTGFTPGQAAGTSAVTLGLSQMPTHTHVANANATSADQSSAGGFFWGNGGQAAYSSSSTTTMNPAAVSSFGGSQPHDNMSPYLVLNFCIALTGIFPSRN